MTVTVAKMGDEKISFGKRDKENDYTALVGVIMCELEKLKSSISLSVSTYQHYYLYPGRWIE